LGRQKAPEKREKKGGWDILVLSDEEKILGTGDGREPALVRKQYFLIGWNYRSRGGAQKVLYDMEGKAIRTLKGSLKIRRKKPPLTN